MVSHLELFGPLATGQEKPLLHHHLKPAHDALVFKVEDLSEADRRRPMTGTGTNLIGVIKHMTWIESWYLCDAVHAYASAAAAADASIESLDLDTAGMHPAGVPISLRSLLLIVLLDTTRHAGHSDIVRELIDGATGGREPRGDDRMADDEYRVTYLARVRGEIDTPAWSAFIRSRQTTAD